ncbi:MAG: drrA 6 [Myxococcaceae bacterium]|nr:drrA 6 [Myxococcaceae bacterium]
MEGAPVIEVTGLGKRFAKRRSEPPVTALDGVTFKIDGHGIVGILGPNGAGKTTLLDILEGLSEPTDGQVRLFGKALRPYPRRRVGVVMQREFVLDNVTVREYAELFASIYGVRGGEAKILDAARLGARSKLAVDRLSGGEAQRLFVAAACVHDPEILFLDEPTSELDPESKARMGDELRALGKARTVLLTTHDLQEADTLCQRLLFLEGGRVRAEGTRDDLVGARGIADAFHHYCSVRIDPRGERDTP